MFKYGTLQHRIVPAPQILLRAYSPGNEAVTSEAEAIVDTGAAMTCIPKRVIEELGETSLIYSTLMVRGAVGRESLEKTYIVHLKIARCDFPDIEVIAYDRGYALIGRDILNKYKITFDGLKGNWEVDAKC